MRKNNCFDDLGRLKIECAGCRFVDGDELQGFRCFLPRCFWEKWSAEKDMRGEE